MHVCEVSDGGNYQGVFMSKKNHIWRIKHVDDESVARWILTLKALVEERMNMEE